MPQLTEVSSADYHSPSIKKSQLQNINGDTEQLLTLTDFVKRLLGK